MVIPDVNKIAVLMAGRLSAGMVSNLPPRCCGPLLGQAGSKSFHNSQCVDRFTPSPPSQGMEYWRAYQSAPKNAAKNITSEKMNHIIPMRNERSTASL